MKSVKSLRANGCTNLSAAVTLAFQELRATDSPNKLRSIFFLTDGHANAGVSNADDLVDLTKSRWFIQYWKQNIWKQSISYFNVLLWLRRQPQCKFTACSS